MIMREDIYSYTTGKYFSPAVRAIGWLVTIFALPNILDGAFFAWIMLPVGFITHFTLSKTEFNLKDMTYREGASYAGFTFGEKLPLRGLDFLFLKKNSYSQTYESRASMATRRMEKYDGYIQLTGGVKLHLLQRDMKELAQREMERIAQDLQLELKDLTELQYHQAAR